ncbi:MAG: hypothetical protein LBE08_01360 [Bifidobacteriaceae bacterium]|jgi:hypothetical protein|nr:hypothetical protein [Bifidobacteriaceae bacterium]
MGNREIWRGKRRLRGWLWAVLVVGVGCVATVVWLLVAHRGMPDQRSIDEAVAPYSTGSTDCRRHSTTRQTFDLPIVMDWMWIDAVTETVADTAADMAPKKPRITARVVDEEGEVRGVDLVMEACDG